MALCAAIPAQAQITACALPHPLPSPRTAAPEADGVRRIVPTAAYTLAISWTPEQCARRGRGDADQCDTRRNRFGFILHGLWPDGAGRDYPQYCRAAAPLSTAQLRRNFCLTPSADLLQHEWAKHGTCMSASPDRYFAQARTAYARVRFPDMTALARSGDLSVDRFTTAFLAANPRLTSRMVRIRLSREGWLEELWLCLDRR